MGTKNYLFKNVNYEIGKQILRQVHSKPEKNGNYHSYIHFDNRLSQECNIASKFQGHVKKIPLLSAITNNICFRWSIF